MTFLQPFLLFALPLVGLPILIHLINRQRHRTIPWAAMMFLLDAKRLTRGMARLRYWLIMAMRMLALAGLIFAVSRPLASGWLGSAVGSRADTTVIVLDRSASMEQQDRLTGKSKRQTAIEKLAELMETTGRGQRVVLVENTRNRAEEIDSASSLRELPSTTTTDTAANVPRMLQTTLDYLVDNEVGQADIWIASDLRRNDWLEEDGRWATLRQSFAELEGIRFHLLTYPEPSDDNLAVSIHNVRKRQLGNVVELVLDVIVRLETTTQVPQSFPIEFVINGARSVLVVEMSKEEFVLQGHVIPLDAATESGWGRVEIPGDANLADNVFYFVFADEPPRHVTLVSDDDQTAKPLRIAAEAPSDPALPFEATVLTSNRVAEIDWAETTLLLWHAPLPGDLLRQQLATFLASGRPIIFFPPASPGTNSFLGVQWQNWETSDTDGPHQVASWRGDSDLLARSLSGTALPIGKLQTLRYCQVTGVGNSLARLSSGDPLLLRADGNVPAYFCATLPRADHSSLARDGVMLYVMVHRALAMGAKQQGDARQVDTGSPHAHVVTSWRPLSRLPDDVVSTSRPYRAGAYQHQDKLLALNRPEAEDVFDVTTDAALARMFSGLDYHQINDQLGNSSPLATEIWRTFLALMAMALLVEGLLCLG